MPNPSSGAVALPLLPTPPGSERRDKGPFPGAENFLPADGRRSLTALRGAAAGCRGCDLHRHATRTVFGEGVTRARIVMVGEQPGDKEDLAGRPFVGPAAAVLDKALAAAGIARGRVYVTNAVKHFKWEARGKRRVHSKPSAREAAACRPWLEYELAALRPAVLVVLGATAGRALLGASFRVGASRGKPITGTRWAPRVVATIHPSAVLRAPDHAARQRELAGLIADLRVAAALV